MAIAEDNFMNMVRGSVEDDNYLDKAEDEKLMQAAASSGMDASIANALIERVMEETGSAREKPLIMELERRLTQFTKQDKLLDASEEQQCLKICEPAPGKKAGLNEEVALAKIESFCSARGITRGAQQKKESGGSTKLVVIGIVALVVVLVVAIVAFKATQKAEPVAAPAPVAAAPIAAPQTKPLGQIPAVPQTDMAADRMNGFNAFLADAQSAVDAKKFTSPPNGSVIFFITKYFNELRESDKQTRQFAALDDRRDQICRASMTYYCAKFASPGGGELPESWHERAQILAGTCRDQELLASCKQWSKE